MDKKYFIINKNGHCRLCMQPDTIEDLVACDECDRWFHITCANIEHRPTREERWICIKCVDIEKQINNMKMEDEQDKETATQEGVFNLQCQALASIVKTVQELSIKQSEERVEPDWTIFLKRQALMSLPTFYGAARDWPTFKNVYDKTSMEGEFSDIENFSCLQQALKGYAFKSVQPLMLDPKNVPKIIQRLEQNFGRPEQIYEELLRDFVKIRKDHKRVVIEISESLENMVCNLEVIGKRDCMIHD